ncbi:MAG: glycosyl transferase family 2 [Firmicutes bacterium]|nr:glycosyl transferase family 2 [Bacillota bacterium]
MSRNISVTLCMITKNEEDYITCCIDSVKHLIDEVIIVDTGSTDRTIDKALQAGARVFNYNWQQNFAEARNYALDQAAGDWILVLDADETLEYVDIEGFNNLLVASHIEGYFIEIESVIGNGEEKMFDQVVRLFRNKPHYRFSGAIHEQVIGSIRQFNSEEALGCTDFKIIHRGYLNERIAAQQKHIRNMEVINQALIDNPYDPFLRYSLGIEYIQQGKIAQANEQLSKSLQKLKGGEGYFHNVLVNLASGYLQTGQLKEAQELIDRALLMLPQDSDIMLLKGITALYSKDYQVAIEFLEQSLTGNSMNTLANSIHTICGDIYGILDDYDNAELEYFTSLQLVPQHVYPLLQMIGLKQKGKSQLTWYEISKFTSQKVSKDLQLKLIKMKELEVVLVLALLTIINQNSVSKTNLIIGCNDYLRAIMLYQPANELSKIVLQYLKYSAEMMLLYASIISANCDFTFLPITQKIADISNDNLDLIIKTLCPTWIPCIKLNKMLPNVEE